MNSCMIDINRTWEDTPFPPPKFDCLNCDDPKYPEQLYWMMLRKHDDTMDGWCCHACCGELGGEGPGIRLSEALKRKQ